MPTNQPSNAPETIEPRNRDTAADVLTDEGQHEQPGGGGMIGEGTNSDPQAGGGATPNSPIDTGVDAGDARAAEEAVNRATGDTPETGRSSQ